MIATQKSLLILACLTSIASSAVLQLTEENYVRETEGRTVFLKMFAPWCGHCKAMAPTWEKLAEEWKDSDVGLVAEVDCTDPKAESLCAEFHIEGFPTILYGDPSAPDEYQGGRDLQSLSDFAKLHISKPVCSMSKPEFCSDDEKKTIEQFKTKSKEELIAAADKVDEQLRAAQNEMDAYIERINSEFEQQSAEHNAKVAKIKMDANYKWIAQILQKQHGVSLKKSQADFEDIEGDSRDEL